MTVKDLKSYQILNEKYVKELNSEGILLEHKKTGARVFLLSNDDENKVFCIGFRTPPSDSTGVPHIMEHSVLCGSAKFPVKDPFVELVKGSLNTFLNAMTYPDKMVYPVASCNDKDFQNLMDVYMDAVLHPNIYKEEKIFRQEGWHYEMESADSPITVNGVVYNEMKGAFSSPEGVLDRYTQNTLYPDTCYTHESGGAPEVIPELTYEDFLNFHRKFYHPSNSFIYLYGNMDMEEKLEFIDSHYLSAFDSLAIDSQIRDQEAFAQVKDIQKNYPVSEDEGEEDNTYLSYNMVVGEAADINLSLAFEVLDYALLSAPGAPLKQALLDAKIGKDIYGSFEDGIKQTYFSIVAKGANLSQKEEFVKVIRDTLTKIMEEGIDKKAVTAGINYYEFRFREADFSSYPKGLMYGLDILSSWLYDDTKPFCEVQLLEGFEFLKKALEEGTMEYAGKYSAPDYERIVDKSCSLAIESTMIYHCPQVKEQLENLGVPVLVERSSYEADPLGRMEWIKLYGVLTGKEQLAEELFEKEIKELENVSVQADEGQEHSDQTNQGKTVAFFYITSRGSANVRKPGDYVAKMITMAGGTYVPQSAEEEEENALSTMNMEMEAFYAKAKDADYIIYNSTIDGELTTMDEFLAKSPLLADFKAVKEGHVWCTGKNLFQETMGLGNMIQDIHRMLTEETPDEGQMHYIHQLK